MKKYDATETEINRKYETLFDYLFQGIKTKIFRF